MKAAALTLIALMSLAGPARAQTDMLRAELLPGWRTPAGTHMAALRLVLAPEWKTYWRRPGDAGIPPEFDWSGSENLGAVRIHWPRPEVFHLNGLRTIGYRRELILPLEVTPRDPARPVVLRAQVDLGVCRDICVPAALTLAADLAGPGAPDPAIRAALADRPATAAEAGVRGVACRVDPIADGLRVTATIDMAAAGREETVVFDPHDPGIWVTEAQTDRQGTRLTAVAEMVAPSGQPFVLDRGALRVVVLAEGRAVEIEGCPAAR